MPEGTSIEVADVFYNLPARRKFLKSDGAESAQVSRIVTQLALCYPEVGFTLTSSGRRSPITRRSSCDVPERAKSPTTQRLPAASSRRGFSGGDPAEPRPVT